MIVESEERLFAVVWDAVHQTPAIDLSTQLSFPGSPAFRAGFSALLFSTFSSEVPEDSPSSSFIEAIWERRFLHRSPLDEASRRILTTLGLLSLDPRPRARERYQQAMMDPPNPEYIGKVFRLANLEAVLVDQDPFAEEVRAFWEEEPPFDPRFLPTLRLDRLFHDWSEAATFLRRWGYGVKVEFKGEKKALREIRRFIREWMERIRAVCVTIAIDLAMEDSEISPSMRLLSEGMAEVCRETGRPLLLLPRRFADGTERSISPSALLFLSESIPNLPIIVAAAEEEDLLAYARLSAKRSSIHLLAGVGDTLTPSILTARAQRSLEYLGCHFIPYASGASVLEELIGRWAHARWTLGKVLQDRYAALHRTGWRLTEEEIQRDISYLFRNPISILARSKFQS